MAVELPPGSPNSVSVVIPAHNAGKFVEEAIRSVLAQEWPVEAVIVVNDGSSDRDYVQLESLAPNVRVVAQPNRGVSAARNRGCELASTAYVAVLDADDVWLPGKLRAQMQHLASTPGCDAVFCLGVWWHPNADGASWRPAAEVARPVAARPAVRQLFYSDFLLGLPVAPSTMVIRRDAWRAIGGFDERRRYAEDQDFYLRLAHQHRVDLVDAVAILYRQHPDNATRKLQNANHWADVIAQAVGSLGLEDGVRGRVAAARVRRRLSDLHVFHGRDHFWHGNIGIARHEFRRALANRPLDPRTALYLTLASLPGMPHLVRRAFRPGGGDGKI